jgi:hypothetical protein
MRASLYESAPARWPLIATRGGRIGHIPGKSSKQSGISPNPPLKIGFADFTGDFI